MVMSGRAIWHRLTDYDQARDLCVFVREQGRKSANTAI